MRRLTVLPVLLLTLLLASPAWAQRMYPSVPAPLSCNGTNCTLAGDLKIPGATSDAAPTVFALIGAHAWPGATTNTTGAVLRLASGIGRRIVTIDDYSQAGTGTVTVTVNGTATVLTAGTDFTAATSNAVTATNLAAAIDAIAGVTATASSAVVRVTPDDTTYSLALARSVAAFATVTTGTNGAVNIGYGDLLAVGPTNVTLASGTLQVPATGIGIGFGATTEGLNWDAGANDLYIMHSSTTQEASLGGSGLQLSSDHVISWYSGVNLGGGADTSLARAAAANLQQGSNAAAPVAQYLSVANVAAGTSDTAGAHRYIDGSQSRGTGAGGSIVFRTAAAGGAGSNLNALAAALTLDSTGEAAFGEEILLTTGKRIYVSSGGTITMRSGAADAVTIDRGANAAHTSGANALINANGVFAPASGSGSWAAIHANPTVDGTSSGTAYGFVVASKTNTLTGGTIKLLSLGTTTTDAFTGYTEKFSVNTAGTAIATNFATGGSFEASATGAFYWNSRAVLYSPAAGMVAFEGMTSAFPALKRSGITLLPRLADDSAGAPITTSRGSIGALTTTASANLKVSNDTEKTTQSATYVKLKEIRVNEPLVGVRVSFELKTSNVLTTATGRVYKNGAAVGAERTDVTGVYVAFTEDFTTFAVGDLIQVYAKIGNVADTAYVQNFRLLYDIALDTTTALSATNQDP